MVIFLNRKTTMHTIEIILLIGLAILLAFATSLEKQQQSISDRLIRLHVVANSDQEGDQQIKLIVRDAVLDYTQEILRQADSQTSAKAILTNNLNQIETIADQTLLECGSTQKANVTLNRELFGTRVYATYALPGGYYDALRIAIGNAAGHNWWCVVYPQICTAATAEEEHTVTVMGDLDQEELAILQRDTREYQIKFRLIELLENILGWFRSGEDGIPVSG